MKAVKSINDIAFLIQARLGSQRCPNKMSRPFADSTLLDIGISKLVESNMIPNANIYVSLYEQELKDIASRYPVPDQIELVSVEEKQTFDIDYEWQFDLYEKLYRLRGE
jgi:CMP-N-acetylneuraminic acid synthetase